MNDPEMKVAELALKGTLYDLPKEDQDTITNMLESLKTQYRKLKSENEACAVMATALFHIYVIKDIS